MAEIHFNSRLNCERVLEALRNECLWIKFTPAACESLYVGFRLDLFINQPTEHLLRSKFKTVQQSWVQKGSKTFLKRHEKNLSA
jgi:hypothetical protein